MIYSRINSYRLYNTMNSNKLLVVALVLLTTINSISSSSSDSFESLSNFKKLSKVGTDGVEVFRQKHEGPQREMMSIRVLAQKPRARMTCDRYPRVCSGVVPADCCNKQCVNVMSDRVNCGMCGKKCKYQESCCKGLCVNTAFDGKNCGKCNNRCKKGSSCLYGMCSYA